MNPTKPNREISIQLKIIQVDNDMWTRIIIIIILISFFYILLLFDCSIVSVSNIMCVYCSIRSAQKCMISLFFFLLLLKIYRFLNRSWVCWFGCCVFFWHCACVDYAVEIRCGVLCVVTHLLIKCEWLFFVKLFFFVFFCDEL